MDTTAKRYDQLLKDTRDNTLEGTRDRDYIDENGLGGTHFEGWRDAKDITVLALYHVGEVSIDVACAHNAKPSDHVKRQQFEASKFEAIGRAQGLAGKDLESFVAVSLLPFAQSLVANGLDPYKLQSVANRMVGRNQALANRESRAIQSMPVVIKNGVATKVPVKAKPLTAKEIAVQGALDLANKREKMAKQIKAMKAEIARQGLELSDALKAEIMANEARKNAPIVVK